MHLLGHWLVRLQAQIADKNGVLRQNGISGGEI
jgi:hypothetical protein